MIVLEMRVVGASSQQPTEPNGNRIIGELSGQLYLSIVAWDEEIRALINSQLLATHRVLICLIDMAIWKELIIQRGFNWLVKKKHGFAPPHISKILILAKLICKV